MNPSGQLSILPLVLFAALTWSSAHAAAPSTGKSSNFRGPLRVHPTNPRYFTDDGQRAIYLAGSHTWNVLQDQGPTYPPRPFDYDGFITFLRGNHPILMDDLAVSNPARIAARRAMSATRRLAERVDLATMTPRPDLASSGCGLAHPAKEYLAYLPASGAVTV
ncbi:MAG: hypothetical protein HY674_04560, partial [Chloroflexi bacterium]|nr:hypothetical protein [Chloroflexota bacterium]